LRHFTAKGLITSYSSAKYDALIVISYIIIDTAGLPELFLWTKSGRSLLDDLISTYPAVVAYVLDSFACRSTAMFLSVAQHASEVFGNTSIPMVFVCNKADLQDPAYLEKRMRDYESVQQEAEYDMLSDEEKEYRGAHGATIGQVLADFRRYLEVIYPH
jgi:GTPase SAR1 family protein